jgi:hypothetical protein
LIGVAVSLRQRWKALPTVPMRAANEAPPSLLVGTQRIDDAGDRVGSAMVFPRWGSQATYITQGLLHARQRLINEVTIEDDE